MKHATRSGSRIADEYALMATLLRSMPPALIILFVLTVIAMNFLSRITLVSLPWLALNAGICVSWLSFLLMDIVAKHYGARAANKLSYLAAAANLTCCLLCFLVSRIWSAPALDMILDGQWSILTASTVAYIVSALVNNYTNVGVGRLFRANPDGKAAYAARSFISTFLSQLLDNFLFVLLAFVVFPLIPGALQVRWTLPQCAGASVACAVLELLSEVIFSPIGYHVSGVWKKKGVGREYLTVYCPNGPLEA